MKRLKMLESFNVTFSQAFVLFVFIAIGYVMTPEQIAISMADTGMVTADAFATAFSNEALTKVLIIGGLCGIVTTWNSFLIGGSRVLFSMSKSKMLPEKLSKLHPKYNTPYVAILFISILSMFSPLFGRVMLIWIVDAANFA